MENTQVDKVVLPGDELGTITADFAHRLGAGLTQVKDKIVATKSGVLRFRAPDKFWVQSNAKRYVPVEGDVVVGVVRKRHHDNLDVDIGCAFDATLPFERFEGATKRNKAPVDARDLVYARVSLANKDMDPELSCVNAKGKAGAFGKLEGGFVFKCSTELCRSVLRDSNVVLKTLGKKVPFEIACGMNGRIWVKSGQTNWTVLIMNALLNSEHLADEEAVAMANKLIQKEFR